MGICVPHIHGRPFYGPGPGSRAVVGFFRSGGQDDVDCQPVLGIRRTRNGRPANNRRPVSTQLRDALTQDRKPTQNKMVRGRTPGHFIWSPTRPGAQVLRSWRLAVLPLAAAGRIEHERRPEILPSVCKTETRPISPPRDLQTGLASLRTRINYQKGTQGQQDVKYGI